MELAVAKVRDQSRLEKNTPREKTASGDFFVNANKSRRKNRRQPLKTQQENRPSPSKTVSGVEETGLYYYGYRYYDPVTGRWPSRDPLGDEVFFQSYMRESLNNLNRKQLEEKIQSVKSETQKNLYAFVNNNSANSVDSFGLIGLTLVGCCSKKVCNIECTAANIAASIVCAGLDSVGVVDVQKCWDAVDEADRLCRKVCKKCILP